MKSFIKMTLAVLAGLLVWCFLCIFFVTSLIGSLSMTSTSGSPMPKQGMLDMDFSTMAIAEQTRETDPQEVLRGEGIAYVGIWDAVQALNAAAEDPAIRFIYLRPDYVSGEFAHLEELRTALEHVKLKGKPIIAFIENPSNASYYIASVADKVYMSSYPGGMNTMLGISARLVFLKDALDKLGVNMQFIRHGKYKSAGEMYCRNDISPENRLQYEALIGSIWNKWAEKMASSRGLSAEDFNNAIDNLELSLPQDFLEMGLVDSLMTKKGMDDKLAKLYGVDDAKDVKKVNFCDYAALKSSLSAKSKQKIAVIYADGEIIDGIEKKEVAGDRFADVIAEVRRDSSVKAVVFRVNSPGGSVLASEKIRTEISLMQKEKPVIASYGGYAASGGYWISAGCNHIFSNATTLTGSIGVFSMMPEFSKTARDLLHINVVSVNSNKHSDMLSGMRPLDEDEISFMQTDVEDIYDRFTSLVAQGRGMEVSQVDEIAQGRVWSGTDALEIGLVDEIGTLEDALRYAAAAAGDADISSYTVQGYPKPLTTLETILEMFGETGARIFHKPMFKDTELESVERIFSKADKWNAPHAMARLPFNIVVE